MTKPEVAYHPKVRAESMRAMEAARGDMSIAEFARVLDVDKANLRVVLMGEAPPSPMQANRLRLKCGIPFEVHFCEL